MNHFFIAGCSRSGEPELNAHLDALYGISIVDTLATAPLFDGAKETLDFWSWMKSPEDALGFDMTRKNLRLPAEIDDVQLRQGWEEVAPIFVFLVRDPRAVVAHLAQRRLEPLLSAFGMPPLDDLRAQWTSEVEAIEAAEPGVATYGRAALWWKMNYAVLEQLRASGENVVAVSYDSFCESPAPHLKAICDALEIKFAADALSPNESHSDEEWRTLLSPAQREIVEAVADSAMRSAWQTGRRA